MKGLSGRGTAACTRQRRQLRAERFSRVIWIPAKQVMARPMVMLVHVAPALPENARTQGATISHTPTHAFVLSAPSEGLARATPAAQATTKPQTTAFAATDPLPPNPIQGETIRTAPSTRLVQSIQDSVVVAEVLFKAFEFTILLQGVRERRAVGTHDKGHATRTPCRYFTLGRNP